MRDALATWHMGRVINAYRNHPWHRQALKQSVVAGWFGLTQTQLSRIENGRAPEEMSKLVRWARLLSIPGDLLWFKVPGGGAQPQPPPARMVPVIAGGQTILLPVDEQAARAHGLDGVLDQLTDAGHSGGQPAKHPVTGGASRLAGGSLLGLMAADVGRLRFLHAGDAPAQAGGLLYGGRQARDGGAAVRAGDRVRCPVETRHGILQRPPRARPGAVRRA
jgi:hypothetical protein